MYKWIHDELLSIERDRAKIDNRLWLLMQKIRQLDEKIEKSGIDEGELLDDCWEKTCDRFLGRHSSRGCISIYTSVWWYIMECPNCLSEKVTLKKSWLGKHCVCSVCKFDWEYVKWSLSANNTAVFGILSRRKIFEVNLFWMGFYPQIYERTTSDWRLYLLIGKKFRKSTFIFG